MLSKNEQHEAEAFNRIAEQCDRKTLRTSDFTFSRYRRATLDQPLFNRYPDLVFSHIGSHFCVKDEIKPLNGIRVLDLGAGDGIWSVILAEQGSNVTSLEIASKQVELARERMRIHGLIWDARVGSAFQLRNEFKPGSFDLIFGQAVLHHLTKDLERVYADSYYLLRDGGYAVFTEPFSGSAFLRSLRERLSWIIPLNAESPDERPLTLQDIESLKNYFSNVEVNHADIFSKFGRRVFRSKTVEVFLGDIDRRLLRYKSFVSLASMVFMSARKS